MADEALSAGAVARRLGVAVTTLRTWHQRYGLGPSQHVPGHHRRYTEADLARLEVMRRLTAQGVTPAEAARWARRAPELLGPPSERPAPPHSHPTGVRDGGLRLAVGRYGPAARGLARAAMRLDAAAMAESIDHALTTDGVVVTWDKLVRPVLGAIGERHAATTGLVEVEHLMSRCVSEAFAAVTRTRTTSGPARILLSCADEEQHSLPLEAFAAALAEAGVPCRLLGARVPLDALVEAVSRTGPAAVAVWSQLRCTASPAQLTTLLALPRRPLLVLAAGPGWQADSLPGEVLRPTSLGEAVSLTLAVRDSLDQTVCH